MPTKRKAAAVAEPGEDVDGRQTRRRSQRNGAGDLAKEAPAATKAEPKAKIKAKAEPKAKAKTPALKREKAEPEAEAPAPGAETPRPVNYWLFKAEPESRLENGHDVAFSIDHLAARGTAGEPWDGVRNHVAKNNMIAMRTGDLGFFYHSNCKVPGVAGTLRVVGEAEPDESAFDAAHPYHDAKSDPAKPRWFCVRVAFQSKFPRLVSLKELQAHRDGALEGMDLLRLSRLSVSKVSRAEWEFVHGLVGVPVEAEA